MFSSRDKLTPDHFSTRKCILSILGNQVSSGGGKHRASVAKHRDGHSLFRFKCGLEVNVGQFR